MIMMIELAVIWEAKIEDQGHAEVGGVGCHTQIYGQNS